MSNGVLKNLFAVVAILLLAVAPAVLRVGDGHPKWVLVRVGSRPAQDDPNQQLVQKVQRELSASEDGFDPIVFVFGVFCAVIVLVGGHVFERLGRLVDVQAGPPVESGLRACLASRAPPGFGAVFSR